MARLIKNVSPRTTDRKLETLLDWIKGFNTQRVDLLKDRTRIDKNGEKVTITITDMPLPVLMCFLYVASHNPCNSQEMSKALQMSAAAVARHTDWLCATRTRSEPGLNLISKRKDPCNLRFKVLQLTQLGEDQVTLFHLKNG